MKFLLTTARYDYDPAKHDRDIKALRAVGYPVLEAGHGRFQAVEFEKDIESIEEFSELLSAMDCDVIIGRPRFGQGPTIQRYDYWVE